MFLQTTNNVRNALHCRVAVSTPRNPAYQTHTSLNYSQILAPEPENLLDDIVIGQRAASSSGPGFGGAELVSSEGGGENDSIASANNTNMIM